MKYKIFDIHTHVVPSYDDGAINLSMAIEMLKIAHSQGARDIICTSHNGYGINRYYTNFTILQQELTKENIDINLYDGCEIYCSTYIVESILSEIDSGEIPTLNGTEYILVEFSPYTNLNEITYCVNKLSDAGYKIIIAHVERYFNLFNNGYDWIYDFQKEGHLFQVNAYSLQDTHDEQIKRIARRLLKLKAITFIGSDAHRTNHRNYNITNGIKYIYEHCDVEYADNICYKNASILLNRVLSVKYFHLNNPIYSCILILSENSMKQLVYIIFLFQK